MPSTLTLGMTGAALKPEMTGTLKPGMTGTLKPEMTSAQTPEMTGGLERGGDGRAGAGGWQGGLRWVGQAGLRGW